MAKAAMSDPSIALEWSYRQRIFMDRVFNRDLVLPQARWLKTRVQQLVIQRELDMQRDAEMQSTAVKDRSPLTRIRKELKRAWKRYVLRRS